MHVGGLLCVLAIARPLGYTDAHAHIQLLGMGHVRTLTPKHKLMHLRYDESKRI